MKLCSACQNTRIEIYSSKIHYTSYEMRTRNEQIKY